MNSRHSEIRGSLLFLICSSVISLMNLLMSSSVSGQTVAAPRIVGSVSDEWGADEHNPCLPDLDAALSALRSHGDIMGFQMNGAQDVSLALAGCAKTDECALRFANQLNFRR